MATNNSSNQDFTNGSDGFVLGGGTTERKLTVTGADVTLAGSGSNTYTLPAATDTLMGRASTDSVTNKDMSDSSNTFPTNLLHAIAGNSGAQTGWAYIVGNGTKEISKTVTFPTAYASAPFVFVSFIGAASTSSGTPSSPSSFTTAWSSFAGAYGLSTSTTGFSIYSEAVATHSSSFNFGYVWLAIG